MDCSAPEESIHKDGALFCVCDAICKIETSEQLFREWICIADSSHLNKSQQDWGLGDLSTELSIKLDTDIWLHFLLAFRIYHSGGSFKKLLELTYTAAAVFI